MGVIANDLSLEGQFNSIEEFLDDISDNILPIIKLLEKSNLGILTSYDFYDLKITNDLKIINLDSNKKEGLPEYSYIIHYLSKISLSEPYWEKDPKSNNTKKYISEFTDKENNYCLAEAFERGKPIVSFKHKNFRTNYIEIIVDEEKKLVSNMYNRESALKILKEDNIIKPIDYLISKFKLDKSFGIPLDKHLFNELVKEASLSLDDINIIVNDMERMINLIMDGKSPGRLSGSIDGKLKEFRTSLSNNREIRIFYFEEGSQIIFLNGFLKKTNKTPPNQIEKAKIFMDRALYY